MVTRPPEGVMPRQDALDALSRELCLILNDGAMTLARRADNDIHPITEHQARLLYAPLRFVDNNGSEKSALPAWLKSEDRPIVKPVFKAGGTVNAGEYNLFSGFAIDPVPGLDNARPFLRHLYRMICRGNRHSFRYFMNWLAHAVQHPGENPEVWLVLKSSVHGTGKSLVYLLLELIFGERHAGTINGDPMPLYKGFNAYNRLWIVAHVDDLEEAQAKHAAALRGCITSNKRRIEEKGVPVIFIQNVLHVIAATTNSGAPIILGAGARRHAIFDVDDRHAGDLPYFERIITRLKRDGAGQMLRLLQAIDLNGWHPRQLPPRSDELIELQKETEVDPVLRYFEACIEAGSLLAAAQNMIFTSARFGDEIRIVELHSMFVQWARAMGEKTVSSTRLSRVLGSILGKREFYREKVKSPNNAWSAGRGWALPSAEEFELRLDAYYDPAKRDELSERVRLVRLAQEAAQPATPKAGKVPLSSCLLRQAGPLAAGLIGAWPRKGRHKSLDFQSLLNEVRRSPPLRGAVGAIMKEITRTYPPPHDAEKLDKALRALVGSMSCDGSVLTVDDRTGNFLLITGMKGLTEKAAPANGVLPAGVLPLKNGSFFDLILDQSYDPGAASSAVT